MSRSETDIRAALARIGDPKGAATSSRPDGRAALPCAAMTPGLVLDIGGLSAEAASVLAGGNCGESRCRARASSRPPRQRRRRGRRDVGRMSSRPPPFPTYGHIVAVASGKGGVGKSTVAVNLAVALAAKGSSVSEFSMPTFTGRPCPPCWACQAAPRGSRGASGRSGRTGLRRCRSPRLTKPGQAVIWRGPMAAAAMMQMLTEADWGDLDVLFIDMPPGTGDIQLSLAQKVERGQGGHRLDASGPGAD